MRIIGWLILMLTLAACGGGDDGSNAPPSELGTLAYVETECRDTKEGFFERQALRIRQGDHAPVTVFETPGVGPLGGIGGLCQGYTAGRLGSAAIARDAFQADAVSPDGTSVVFEVTDEFSVPPHLPLNLPPEQRGIFWVRANGTGLRRLAPPSRERFFYVQNGGILQVSYLVFSPSGRTIAFVDRDGQEADQIVTIDVATGARQQVTHLREADGTFITELPGPSAYGPYVPGAGS
jgi:hypothetical protein